MSDNPKEEWVGYPRGKTKPTGHMIFGTRIYFADETDIFIIKQDTEIANLRWIIEQDAASFKFIMYDCTHKNFQEAKKGRSRCRDILSKGSTE